MNRPKYKELYLKEKYNKEHYKHCVDIIIERLKLIDLITFDKKQILDNHLYRGIEITKGKKKAQIMLLWEEENE